MFSDALQRHIDVPIAYVNQADHAEIDAAIAALPNYPETTPSQVRAAAERGDLNAIHVLAAAENGDPVAQDWI